ncbi:MAG: ATP-binding protein [bacterium]|nr:ATP-binding protein [bacterium]
MEQLILLVFVPSNIFLGLFILINDRRSWTNRLFVFLVCVLTVYLVLNTQLSYFEGYSTKLFLSRFIISLGSIINLLVYLFLHTFPKDKLQLKKTMLIALISVTMMLFIAGFTNLIFKSISIEDNVVVPQPGLLMPVFLLHTIILVFGGIVTIFLRYRKSLGQERAKIRYVFIGFIILFSLIIILNFLLPVFLKFGYFVSLLPIYILLFNVIITYAIVRYRLMEIKLIVARTVTYFLLVTTLAGVYASGLFVVGNFITREPSSSVNLITSTLLALVMAFTFQPLRRRLERATDKLFYRDRYDVNHLLGKLGRLMASTYDLTDLSQGVLDQMESNLKATNATIVLVKGSRVDWSLTVGSSKSKLVANDIKKVIAAGPNKGSNVLVFDELDEGGVKEIMRKNEFSVVVPLIAERVVIGALILGDKASGDVYTSEDINVLEIIGPQISVAIDNARAYEEIKQFNIKLKKEIEEATSNLRGANKRLRDLDKIKDEFISITSHELRTPMTAVKSYLWMVLNKSGKNLGKKGTDHLNRAYVSTQRTINLVNDMLDVSRIEGNRFEINKEKIDIVELANECMRELMGRAHERKVKLLVQKKKMQLVFVDHDKIYQVMDNLIGNALKFTPKGGLITVGFASKGKFIAVGVRDTGTGISKADQKRLFKKFGRVESSYTAMAEVGGTGLGLYVSKQIVEMHGGKIWIESEVGKGSTFLFTIPVAKA